MNAVDDIFDFKKVLTVNFIIGFIYFYELMCVSPVACSV